MYSKHLRLVYNLFYRQTAQYFQTLQYFHTSVSWLHEIEVQFFKNTAIWAKNSLGTNVKCMCHIA